MKVKLETTLSRKVLNEKSQKYFFKDSFPKFLMYSLLTIPRSIKPEEVQGEENPFRERDGSKGIKRRAACLSPELAELALGES